MTKTLPVSPFGQELYLGTVTQVSPASVRTNLPFAAGRQEKGERSKGIVGDFVFIETLPYAVFGRITDVRLPDRERLTVQPSLGLDEVSHPLGTIQLLASVNLAEAGVEKGMAEYPRLGDRVYLAHPDLIAWMSSSESDGNLPTINLASLPGSQGNDVDLNPEQVFARHCAVLGSTGGGKSWTLSRLVEETRRGRWKALLIDATGEFHTLPQDDVIHCSLGETTHNFEELVRIPYRELTETDLFVLFQPSGGAQAPKMREAIKSLKLVDRLAENPHTGVVIQDGLLKKSGQRKAPVIEAQRLHSQEIDSPYVRLDISKLAEQIVEECVWPTGHGNNQHIWGGPTQTDVSYCVSLINRIEAKTSAAELGALFSTDGESLFDVIEAFLVRNDKSVLRISMENLSFEHNARELMANCLGRYLLGKARRRDFEENPLIVFVDEAHQFLNRAIGETGNEVRLEAFGLIAKEGRKYGLTSVLATQRPRDIPEDVLSQVGCLIVHRLINERDRAVVENACGDLDKSATAFLPTLEQGQAIVVGVDFPMPLAVSIKRPTYAPKSRGPKFR